MRAPLSQNRFWTRSACGIFFVPQTTRARACLEQLEALWRHRITALDAVLSKPKE